MSGVWRHVRWSIQRRWRSGGLTLVVKDRVEHEVVRMPLWKRKQGYARIIFPTHLITFWRFIDSLSSACYLILFFSTEVRTEWAGWQQPVIQCLRKKCVLCPATWILLWPHADWSLQLNLNKVWISIQEHLVIFGHSVYASSLNGMFRAPSHHTNLLGQQPNIEGNLLQVTKEIKRLI